MTTPTVSFDGLNNGFSFAPRGLKGRLLKTDMLEMMSESVDFIPLTGNGITIRTTPLADSSKQDMNFRFKKAAEIVRKNPLCYIATKALQDEVTSANLIVEEKQGNTWNKHHDNPLEELIESPNEYIDKHDFLRAWVTHLPNFGFAQVQIFSKGEKLPSGTINNQNVALDIPFPTQLSRDMSQPNAEYYRYKPYYTKEILAFRSDRVLTDKNYDAMYPYAGISASMDVLDRIFEIDRQYTGEMGDFFNDGGMPRGLLIKRVDVAKDPKDTMNIKENDLQEQIQKMYYQVNGRGGKRNLAALRGDWDYQQLSAGIESLLQKDLLHNIQMLVSGVYGVPASLFWVGLQLSNQRASREMDAIGFFERTIWNLFMRIQSKLNHKLPALFNLNGKFRFRFDVTEMPLAQALRLQKNREVERWFQEGLINRGKTWHYLGMNTNELTEAEANEMYQGNKGAGANLNNAAGEQSQTDRTGQD